MSNCNPETTEDVVEQIREENPGLGVWAHGPFIFTDRKVSFGPLVFIEEDEGAFEYRIDWNWYLGWY